MKSVEFRYSMGKNKVLTMSYDDGVVQDKRLIEIFNKYGIKGSFHLNGGFLDAPYNPSFPRFQADEVKDVYFGHELSCHGYTHPFLERLATMEIVHQILDDKKALERACGYVVRGMSYPYGTYSSELIEVVRKLGMNYARTVNSTGNFDLPNNFLAWNPTCHHSDKRLLSLLENFRKTARNLSVFYVWGHSYEFDKDNNWNMIEEFCSKAGGNSDVWYATNIEIFDYVTAMRKCELSADRTMLYNPSAVSVWVKVGEKIFECKGGETTRLD